MWEMQYYLQLGKWDFQMYWRCIVCCKVGKNLLSISQYIEQGNKVEFEAPKCWLESFDSNKLIVEVVQKGRS
jgi:hypothetical protein